MSAVEQREPLDEPATPPWAIPEPPPASAFPDPPRPAPVGPSAWAENLRLPDRARALRRDVASLLQRLLPGLVAYPLLALGLAAVIPSGVALGFATVFVLPWLALAVTALWLTTVLVGVVAPPVRAWRRRLPFRTRVARAVRPVLTPIAAVVTWWLLAFRRAARRDRSRLAVRHAVTIPAPHRQVPRRWTDAARIVMADPMTWRDLAHTLVGPAYAVVACSTVAGMLVGGMSLLVATPSIAGGLLLFDLEAWAAMTSGLLLLSLSPWVAERLARGAVHLAVGVLSPGQDAAIRAELDDQRLRRQLAVDAAERERRRIERDLHDGAQQRLVALGITLGLARQALPDDPDAGAALVAEAHEEAKRALAELRDLSRGIHPAILGDLGLDAALSDLLRRSPVPTSIIVTVPERPPTAVESTAYFVVAEALTNVARHASAQRASVHIRRTDDLLVVEVADDGIGGADRSLGTGLAGLAERVEAHDGHLSVDSPVGGPTTVRAELPCGW
ncbi:sensor histidine kinase [Euzebya sp.]|uniref:sensor histidine kinase n=1 Tax=Euzebya sp. TaxID=1971409 RepID=UPI0035124FD4